MTCAEFLEGFSDFHDSDPAAPLRAAFEEHLRVCASCARYRKVVESGVALLRSVPPTPVRDDFRDRLRHSIYNLEEKRRAGRGAPGGFLVMAGAAAAAVMVVVVGGALVSRGEPVVELAPLVVERSAEPASLGGSGPAEPLPLFSASEAAPGAFGSAAEGGVAFAPVEPAAAPLEFVGVSTGAAPRLEPVDLWESSNALLYRNSSLYQRHREPGLVRTGLR